MQEALGTRRRVLPAAGNWRVERQEKGRALAGPPRRSLGCSPGAGSGAGLGKLSLSGGGLARAAALRHRGDRKRLERAGEVWLFLRDLSPVSVAVVSRSRGLSVMGAVWSALLVGGVWLERFSFGCCGLGKGGECGAEEGRPPKEAAWLRAEIRAVAAAD